MLHVTVILLSVLKVFSFALWCKVALLFQLMDFLFLPQYLTWPLGKIGVCDQLLYIRERDTLSSAPTGI